MGQSDVEGARVTRQEQLEIELKIGEEILSDDESQNIDR